MGKKNYRHCDTLSSSFRPADLGGSLFENDLDDFDALIDADFGGSLLENELDDFDVLIDAFIKDPSTCSKDGKTSSWKIKELISAPLISSSKRSREESISEKSLSQPNKVSRLSSSFGIAKSNKFSGEKIICDGVFSKQFTACVPEQQEPKTKDSPQHKHGQNAPSLRLE